MSRSGFFLSKLFSPSPLHDLQRHMSKVAACSGELTTLFNALAAGDRATVEASQRRVHKLENEADDIKKQVRLHLPRSLLLPVARTDLLELLAIQDQIANTAQDIAGVLVGRRMRLPPATVSGFQRFLDSAIAATRHAEQGVSELIGLFESGFRGAELEVLQSLIENLDQIERENDEIEVELRAKLFALEGDLPPVDVMFLYQIIGWIGDLANESERVGSRLQLLLER
ncbi:MAG TPA: TIGR00153 family protein [Salinisphaeraceae bacterium]|nr:TIGR00153 family protein [Salinisphaeraceae bacterium]